MTQRDREATSTEDTVLNRRIFCQTAMVLMGGALAGCASETDAELDVSGPDAEVNEDPGGSDDPTDYAVHDPEPIDTTRQQLTRPSAWAFSPDVVAAAMSLRYLKYEVRPVASITEGLGNNLVKSATGPVIVALAAYSGDTRTYETPEGRQTPAARLLGQLQYWGNGEQTAPAGRAGYAAQYDLSFVASVAIARRIPSVWNALTSTERTRIDLAMMGQLVGNVWVMSDHSAWKASNTSRTVRGYQGGQTTNPNFTTPMRAIPILVALYMGADGGNGFSRAQDYLNNWNRDVFAWRAINVGGLVDLSETYRRRWTRAVQEAKHGPDTKTVGEGPTKEQLYFALTGGGTGRTTLLGRRLDQVREWLIYEIGFCCNGIIYPGPRDQTGGETGPGVSTRHGFKTASNTNGVLRACLADKRTWAGLPNFGQVGLWKELHSSDGRGLRSAMSYSVDGLFTLLAPIAVIAIYGAVNPTGTALAERRARLERSITDLRYKTQNTYRSYSKGGSATTFVANNEDWNAAWATQKGYQLSGTWALGQKALAWLGGAL